MRTFRTFFACVLCAVALVSCGNSPRKEARDYDNSHHPYANYCGNKIRFNALLYWDPAVEEGHVEFDEQAIAFFKDLTVGDGFKVDVTTTLDGYSLEELQKYSVIVALNAQPSGKARKVFEDYMENGGGWLGFHASAYNDKNTDWPWFVKFIGGGAFYANTWPPQPGLVEVENRSHDVTKNLPAEFVVPKSEFYQWEPQPGANPDIEVLLSLSQKNFPMGLKDVNYGGEWPIVWTNRKYRMVYLNVGHGNETFTSPAQNLLIVNALRWVVSKDPSGNPFDK